jgi:DNA polymerase III subunit delta
MLLFLHGPDTFRSRQQLKKMIEKFKADRDPHGYNVVRLDCAKESPGKIMEHIMAVPFLAEKRMIVIENLITTGDLKEFMAELLERIETGGIPESNILLFWEGVAEKSVRTKNGKALFARLKKETFAQEFENLSGSQLSHWIQAEIKERGGEIARDAVQYLVQHVGGDMWRLSSLIDQLVAYKSDEEIVLGDVQLFLDEKADDNIFNLVDSIVAGQGKKVFGMIEEQYRMGKNAGYVFAMVVRQFRILLQIRDLLDRDESVRADQVAAQLNIKPFVVKKSLPLVRRYTLDQLKTMHQELLCIDIDVKTGKGGQGLLLDVFVGRHAT